MEETALREAKTFDLRNIVNLLDRTTTREAEMMDWELCEDRMTSLLDTVAQLIARGDVLTLVSEHNGRIMGFFAALMDETNIRRPCCVVWPHFIQNKHWEQDTRDAQEKIREWAELKGCRDMRVQVLSKDSKTMELYGSIGYNEVYAVMEMEV